MSCVFLSLGSNINRHNNLSAGLTALREQFGALQLSPVYESEAIGFVGDNFLNLVVLLNTSLPLGKLSAFLKELEDQNGRQRAGPKFSSRTLDIDIVIYGEQCGKNEGITLPRPELYYNAFVLKPMSDLAPESIDPKTGKTYLALWNNNKDKLLCEQKLWEVIYSPFKELA